MNGRHDDDGATPSCAPQRLRIELALDGELSSAARGELARHLERCAGCRDHRREEVERRRALRALPALDLPAEAVTDVLARTVDAAPAAPGAGRRWPSWLGWAAAAAAAVLLVGVLVDRPAPEPRPDPSPAELRRAAVETRLALAVTARALHKSETLAVREVLADEVGAALRRVPLDWPERPSPRRPTLSDERRFDE